ncbi:MAG: hypothetical protein IJA34_14440 [Lachnospiraceae bacterium]|nr:hypothetical protein [Lachnospiraceae bacterium]
MKKLKFISVVALIFISSVFIFSGCKKTLLMDEEKCAEVALEYMENKYGEEFVVLNSGEKGWFFGKSGYANVKMEKKSDDIENEYIVVVYPNNMKDKNNDGYYDSYKIISDTYMSEIINQYARKQVEHFLIEVGLKRFITRINVEEIVIVEGFCGFSEDFSLIGEKEFSLEQLLDNYCIDIDCNLEVPESEISDSVQNDIIGIFEPLISDDSIYFDIEIYSEDIYREREKMYKQNENLFKYGNTNILKGKENISFFVESEEK